MRETLFLVTHLPHSISAVIVQVHAYYGLGLSRNDETIDVSLYLDVSDERLHDPFSLFGSSEVEALETLLLTEDKVICTDHKQVAFNLLVDFLLYSGIQKSIIY